MSVEHEEAFAELNELHANIEELQSCRLDIAICFEKKVSVTVSLKWLLSLI